MLAMTPTNYLGYITGTDVPNHYCIPSEDDPRRRFYRNDKRTGWADLMNIDPNDSDRSVLGCSASLFSTSTRASDLTTIHPGNRCLIAQSPDGETGRGLLEDEPADDHPRGAVVQSQSISELERVVKFQVGEINTPLGKVEYPTLAFGALGKFVLKALSWDYSFLDGQFGTLFKYVFLYPLSAVIVLMLIKVFIDALSRLRSLIPFI